MDLSNHEHFVKENQTPLPQVSAPDNFGIPLHQQEPIFSSQRSIMDYVTLEGIENRTGIEKQNVYAGVVKELLDNATDYSETQHTIISRREKIGMAAAAEVQVTILNQDNKFLRIIVVNSNQYGKAVFSKDMVSYQTKISKDFYIILRSIIRAGIQRE